MQKILNVGEPKRRHPSMTYAVIRVIYVICPFKTLKIFRNYETCFWKIFSERVQFFLV